MMTLEDADSVQRALEKVANEIDVVFATKPPFPLGRLRAFRILAEEVGEVARAVGPNGDDDNLKEELIQVAAVATIWASKIRKTK